MRTGREGHVDRDMRKIGETGTRGRLRALAALVAACGLVAVGTGCSTMGGSEPLSLSLVNLEVQESTLFETSLKATVRITNPNPEPVEVSGAYLKLYLDAARVGDGTYQGPVSLDGLSSSVVEVPFHVSHVSLLRRALSIVEREALDWTLKTVVWVEGGMFGRHKVKVVDSGRLDFNDVLGAGTGAAGAVTQEAAPPPPGD